MRPPIAPPARWDRRCAAARRAAVAGATRATIRHSAVVSAAAAIGRSNNRAAPSGGDTFTVVGVPLAQDAVLAEAGVDLQLGDAITIGASYSGQFADGVTQNGVSAIFRLRF